MNPMPDLPERLLKLEEVSRRVGFRRAKIYQMIAAGVFPKPYRVTGRAVRWRELEISDWIANVVAASRRDGHHFPGE